MQRTWKPVVGVVGGSRGSSPAVAALACCSSAVFPALSIPRQMTRAMRHSTACSGEAHAEAVMRRAQNASLQSRS